VIQSFNSKSLVSISDSNHGRGAITGAEELNDISHAAHQLKDELLMIIPVPFDIAIKVAQLDID
jgi:hypothetical protein